MHRSMNRKGSTCVRWRARSPKFGSDARITENENHVSRAMITIPFARHVRRPCQICERRRTTIAIRSTPSSAATAGSAPPASQGNGRKFTVTSATGSPVGVNGFAAVKFDVPPWSLNSEDCCASNAAIGSSLWM